MMIFNVVFRRASALVAVCVVSGMAHAIEISSMFSVSDANGQAIFTIKNDQDKRIFMNAGMFEMNVAGGEIDKIAYTRENIKDWKISISPAKTIIVPGHSKDFVVTMNCGSECDYAKDELFQLAFVPTPYVPNDLREQQVVQMAVGFAAIFLHPVDDAPLDYRAQFDGEKVVLENLGGSYLKARLSTCPEHASSSERASCTQELNVVSGRRLEMVLPAAMQQEYVDVHIETNTGQYSDYVRLMI